MTTPVTPHSARPTETPLRSLLTVSALVLGLGWAMQQWREHAADRLGPDLAAAARPGDITMLSSTTCVYCKQARLWFTRHGVPFSECFIERDADCARRYAASLSPGTPVLLVRGATLVGFAPADVLGALERAARRSGRQ